MSQTRVVVVVDDNRLNRECVIEALVNRGFDARGAWDLPSLFAGLDGGSDNLIVLFMGTKDSQMLLHVSLDLEPKASVIVAGLSADQDSGVVACAEAGAVGILLSSESLEHLVELIRGVDDGLAKCSPEVSAILLKQVYDGVHAVNGTGAVSVTIREREILDLLQRGLSNQQIASQLSVTVHTVKNHVHSLLAKLGVRSRTEAAVLARTMKFTDI